MQAILQNVIPYDVSGAGVLPGIAPTTLAQWLHRDEAFAGQMALRDRLLRTRREQVLALDDGAVAAAGELLDLVVSLAYPGAGDAVTRPDGTMVALDRGDPLATLGRLVQEDFCILQKSRGAHILTGAILCFPASWTLSEKFLRPLGAIHASVPEYTTDIGRRVQRLFDGVRVGRPLWRFNALWYDDPALFQPRREADRRQSPGSATAGYFRSERQCILRLPVSRAVVFSIHTYVVARARAGRT